MSLRNAVILMVSLGALAAAAAPRPDAQQPASNATTATAAGTTSSTPEGGVPHYIRPETPQERQERLGTQEDPGLSPDPKQVYIRFGKPYTIHRYEKKYSKAVRPGWVRPIASMNFTKEIYQENEKYVWVWESEFNRGAQKREKLAEEAAAAAAGKDEAIAYFEWLRGEFTPLAPQSANVEIKFEESSKGLPTIGSWRNGLAVADMNEDGFEDLVVPPQRGEAASPSIYLGDGAGNWKRWMQVKWDSKGFNYGTAAVADFNKDKHLDVAFAVHLTGVAVFLGDGQGKFRRVDSSIPRDFPTRRIVTTDVDADGYPDIVAIGEGPLPQTASKAPQSNLRAYLNRQKGESWQAIDIAQPKQGIGGDWLSAGDFNGDKYPDFIGASIYFNGTQIVHMSGAEAKSYRVFTDASGKILPARSYYHANAVGHFTSKKTDDAIVAFSRAWPGPERLNPKTVPPPPLGQVIGFDRLSFEGGQVKRTPIVRWGGSRALAGLGQGDFNGDGNLDFAYTKYDPRELVVMLGDGAGNFKKATVSGVNLAGLRNYEIKVADVNADKRPDVIVMYESQETTGFAQKNGRIQVFLNRGAVAGK